MPEIIHIFIYRKTMPKVLESMERMLKVPWNDGIKEKYFFRFLVPSLPLSNFFDSFARFNRDFLNFTKPKNTLDWAFICYLISFATFFHSKSKVSYFCLTFEELVGDPRTAMEKIFALVGIDRKNVENAINAMQRDSQMGTVLSQENTKLVPITPLTLERCKRYNSLCTLIGVPKLLDD